MRIHRIYGKQYRHEMTEKDHVDLLNVLKEHSGPVLLSGYDSDLYNEMLSDWYRDEITTMDQTATKRREVLWMNYKPKESQLTLWEGKNDAT